MNLDNQSDALVAILLVTDAELQQTGASVSNFVSQVKPSCSCSMRESLCLPGQTGPAVLLQWGIDRERRVRLGLLHYQSFTLYILGLFSFHYNRVLILRVCFAWDAMMQWTLHDVAADQLPGRGAFLHCILLRWKVHGGSLCDHRMWDMSTNVYISLNPAVSAHSLTFPWWRMWLRVMRVWPLKRNSSNRDGSAALGVQI